MLQRTKLIKLLKIILGVVTLAAPVLFLAFFSMASRNILGAVRWHVQPTLIFRQLLFAYMLACGALILGYLIHAWKCVPAAEKRFWMVSLVLLNIFVAPVYWYGFVWKHGEG